MIVLAAAFDDLQVDELHEAVVAGFDLRLFGDASGRSADVERAHRELRAGFADGLRGDDADRFAELDHAARWRGCGRSRARKHRDAIRR